MALSTGQRITLLRIDDVMAMSHRYEMEIRETLDPQPVGYQGRKTRLAIVRQRGKRKDHYLDLEADDIVLLGWNAPFRTDTEGAGIMAGSADNEAALAFVEYLVSEAGQSYFVEQTFEYPLVPGIDAPEGLPTLESLLNPELDLSDLDDLSTTQELLARVGLI